MDTEEARQQASIIRRELLAGHVVRRQHASVTPTERGYDISIADRHYTVTDVDVAVHDFFNAVRRR